MTNEVTQERYAIQAKRAERIGDSGDRDERPKNPRRHTSHPSNRLRRRVLVRDRRTLGDDEIGASLEALDQLGQMFRLVGEVGLHDDHRVASRIASASRHLAAEHIEGTRIADMLGGAHDRQW